MRSTNVFVSFHFFCVHVASSDSDKQVWARPAVPKIDIAKESLSEFHHFSSSYRFDSKLQQLLN